MGGWLVVEPGQTGLRTGSRVEERFRRSKR